jgi:apolipoprotein D and lipocalin family protein
MNFDINQYLGKWYEIARIENEFQPKMEKVTAQYNLIRENYIDIINSGYLNDKLVHTIGRAVPTDNERTLKVHFQPDIYSFYNILFVDDNYQYALVSGNSKEYLWILSRTPELDKNITDKLIDIAKENGFNVNDIVFTKQVLD